jgi:inorganic triphosphatase YgiF
VDAIERHPLFAERPAERRRLISIYFDTEDCALRKAGATLRVRDTREGFVQTIKTAGAELFDRGKWEQRVANSSPDLAAARRTGLPPFAQADIRAHLKPRFETAVERKLYHLRRNGSDIELALDAGEVRANGRETALSEVELELKAGHLAELFRLARELSARVPLRLEVKTKADRGYDLIEAGKGPAEKAAPVVLEPAISCAEAFRIIARNCLRQIIANEPAVCAGYAEALHQMRIGLRRLRAAVRAFAEMTAGPEQKKIITELKWITKVLGPARDLDVFAEDVLHPLRKEQGSQAGFVASHQVFVDERDRAYANAVGNVRSDRFRSALLDIAEWIAVGSWNEDKARASTRAANVKSHAALLLKRLRKAQRKRGRDLQELSPKQRHELRIRAKTLRYTIEFFASLFPGERNKERRATGLKALKDMQDALGALNDLAAREKMAAEKRDLDPDAARLLGIGAHKADGLIKDAEAAYARLAEVKSFWK